MAALNWAPKKFFRVFHEILIKRPFKCNIYRKRSLFSPSCPACLLPQASKECSKWRNKSIRNQKTKIKDKVKRPSITKKIKEPYLAILPGKPKCRVASMWPTSIPNSRAFVAATPQRFPPKKSLSILLLSCSILNMHFLDKLNYKKHIIRELSYFNNRRHLIYLSSVSSTISTHRLNQMGCSLLKNFAPLTMKRIIESFSWNYL